jgi:hypothetical protein
MALQKITRASSPPPIQAFEGRLQRGSMLIEKQWIPAFAGMTMVGMRASRTYLILNKQVCLVERGNAGLGAAEDQRMHVVRAFVGVHGFEIEHVSYDVKFIDNTVGAVHVSRHPRDVQRLAG